MIDLKRCLELLGRWGAHSERYWYAIPDRPGLGCYGTGYNSWGVQTNQKYLAAMAVLAMRGGGAGGLDRGLALERALGALRFSLASHVSGDFHCTDGTRWGHTWISGLGIERMMHGVYLLEPHLSDEDRAGLRRMLVSESDWLLGEHQRGKFAGIQADVWGASGKNWPESNLWNGALLWRTAEMYPEHAHAADWKEQAHRFLINSVSVAADAADGRIVGGKPVREWFAGANFFPNYALDHHKYLNVGYMAICVSNAAMLHFDLRLRGLDRPESLDHHQAELWGVLRRMVFSDGRLARIGGDSRVRYAYCQEYLLPSLLYAADHLEDGDALWLAGRQVGLMEAEAGHNGDGSFYSRRLGGLMERSPYYYTRLESDRANVLGMAAVYLPMVEGVGGVGDGGMFAEVAGTGATAVPRGAGDEAARERFERSVAGGWVELEHGAVMHRSASRLASFAWRAYGLGQGMCQPPDDGHLAEWRQNLGGAVRFVGDDESMDQRKLLRQRISSFEGGFATAGAVREGMKLEMAEGWRGTDSATMRIVFVALPDGRTVIGMQHCRIGPRRTYVREVKGLLLNLPNDVYNDFEREIGLEGESVRLTSPAEREEVIRLGSAWANVSGRVGVVGLYGAGELSVHRSPGRRGGKFGSLYVEEICWGCGVGTRAVDAGEVVLDVGWAVVSDATAEETERFAMRNADEARRLRDGDRREIRVTAMDGREYEIAAAFAAGAERLRVREAATGRDLAAIED